MCNRMLTASQALPLPIPWVNRQEWKCGECLSCLANALMCFDTFRREKWLLLPRRGLRSVTICQASTFILTFEPDDMNLRLQLDNQLEDLAQFMRSSSYTVSL